MCQQDYLLLSRLQTIQEVTFLCLKVSGLQWLLTTAQLLETAYT